MSMKSDLPWKWVNCALTKDNNSPQPQNVLKAIVLKEINSFYDNYTIKKTLSI